MNIEHCVEEALILLVQMSEEPNAILQVLDEAEQAAVMRELGVLAAQAAAIHSSADLLKLADAIHCLVEDRPRLGALLLPEGTDVQEERAKRVVAIADQRATAEPNVYVQERAPLIRNAVIESRAQLAAALQKTAEPKHTPAQEQKP